MVEGVVFGMVASVDDSGVELLAVLLKLEEEVAGRGRVVGVVVVMERVEALKVSSSVIFDLLKRK